MGFASMFEDIVERLGGEIPTIVMHQGSQKETTGRQSGVSQAEIVDYQAPPPGFLEKVSIKLVEDGIPSYLHSHFANWICQVMTKQKSVEQTWKEFESQAIPLLTRHLLDNDPITVVYVKRMMR